MGLFDRLFGRKKEEEVTSSNPQTEKVDFQAGPMVDQEEKENRVYPSLTEESEGWGQTPSDQVRAEESLLSHGGEMASETSSELEKGPSLEDRYLVSLEKTNKSFGQRFNAFIANFRTVDETFFEELEETLIMSDVGAPLALEITEELRGRAKLANAKSPEDLREVIISALVDRFEEDQLPKKLKIAAGLTIYMFVGVNGAGKTTTIGKLARRFQGEGKKILLAAGDTFRAGATDQLVEWGRRSQVEVVTGKEGSDPASVVYDAVQKARTGAYDILLIDTAGRLQNKDYLMKELEKMGKIVAREFPEAPQETLLVLDATTGQNAVQQAKEFSKVTPVTGIVLTKLDGSAKGGIILSIIQTLKLPIKLVGLGEKPDDLADFDEELFLKGLFKGLV